MKRLFLACMLVSGIAAAATADGIPPSAAEAPAEQGMPAAVLLRIGPEIRQLTIVASLSSRQGATWTYPVIVGPAFIDLLTSFVRTRFGSVTTDALLPVRATVAFRLIDIRPEIIEAGAMVNISIDVTARLTVSDDAGHPVFSMVATGHGQRAASSFPADINRPGRSSVYVFDLELANRSAVEHMLQKFGTAIAENAELRQRFNAP